MSTAPEATASESENMTKPKPGSATVKTSAEIAVERASAMAAASGMPTHDTTSVPDEAKQIAELTAELEQMRDIELRARADFSNTRKRLMREKEDAIRFANAALVERLLPVFDSFELGLAEARKHKNPGSIVHGFELVLKQMAEFLKEQGVEPVDAEGQLFDPNLHQALGHQENADVPEGHVCAQVRKGYKLRDRLLRPAMVFVSKGPLKSAE